MRAELCPEGSSQYACNIILEQPKCTEDKVRNALDIINLLYINISTPGSSDASIKYISVAIRGLNTLVYVTEREILYLIL